MPVPLSMHELKEFLEEKARQYNCPSFIEEDPVSVPHQYDHPLDIEIAAFLTATISWGQRPTIIQHARKLMDRMGESPYDFIRSVPKKDLHRFLDFNHRTFQGADCLDFICMLKNIYRDHASLKELFENAYHETGNIKETIISFRKTFLHPPHTARAEKHISDPAKGSAAKRLNLFLRWMVREDHHGVDFGCWKGIPMSGLMIPLDVHSGNVARKLGLLQRKQNDWKAVEDLTTTLRTFDAYDPVKYDYALFGLGIFEKF
jgi:uncharacterized protein (TIGR02757 family)